VKQRDWETNVIVGFKGQGKSPYIRELIKAYDLRKQQILVICPSNPLSFQDLIELKSLKALKGRKWHGIFKYYNNEDEMQMLYDIKDLCDSGDLKNGAIFFDDCAAYMDSNVPRVLRSFLINHKNKDLDLFFVSHMLRMVPPFIRGNSSTVTVFKTAETFEKVGDMRALDFPNYEELFNAWMEVKGLKKTKNWIQPHITIETGV
jgi:hypothetical protein